MRAVAEFILEFYGIKAFELRNPESIKRYGLKESDVEVLNQFYPIDNKIMEFFRKEY
jgi:O-phosphoseryl-tRNA(Cys) synthetase